MTTKCTGLMGRIFGHKWHQNQQIVHCYHGVVRTNVFNCQRCGAVTGEKK